MKGEIIQFVPYEGLKWFWTILVGTQRCFWVLVILWNPAGGPLWGPERISEKSNHVGYQFSQFSALKTNTFKISNQDSHGVAHGRPWVPLGGLQRTLWYKACWVSILLRLQHWKWKQGQHTFKISNQTPMGCSMGVQGPPWEVSKEPNDIRHVGYQFYSDFSTENEYRVNTPLKLLLPSALVSQILNFCGLKDCHAAHGISWFYVGTIEVVLRGGHSPFDYIVK